MRPLASPPCLAKLDMRPRDADPIEQRKLSRGKRIALVLGLSALTALVVATLMVRSCASDYRPLEERALGQDELVQALGREAADVGRDSEGQAHEEDVPEEPVNVIHGVVLRPTGEPAAGALVTAQATDSETLFEAIADVAGQFTFDALPEGLYLVEASLEGFGPAVAIGLRPPVQRVQLTLQGGRELFGLVLQGADPVPGALLRIGAPGVFPPRSARSDAAGRVRFSGLRPGRYEWVATAEGRGSGFGGTFVVDDASASAQELRVEFPLQRAPTMRLRVVGGSERVPVEGAVLSVSAQALHVVAVHSVLQASETEIDWLPRGTYHARVRAPGYLPWEGPLMVGAAAEREIVLARGARVEGVVVTQAQRPVPGVQLTAYVETPEGARWELRRSLFEDFHRLVRTDGTHAWTPSFGYVSRRDGTYALGGLPTGTVRVVAEHPDFAPAVSRPVTLLPNQVYEPLRLVLEPGRALRGRVEDGRGGAISRAQVSWRPRAVPPWAGRDALLTGSAGTFTLEGLPAAVTLSVRHPDFRGVEVDLDLPPEGRDQFIIQLGGEETVIVRGRVFTERGEAAAGATVWLMRGESELPVCRASVDGSGWFEAGPCTAQPERIIIAAPNHAPLIADLGGRTEEREWRLRRGGEIEIVTQRTPVVVHVRSVATIPRALWPAPSLDLDRWKRHRLPFIAPGTYVVECQAEGFGSRDVRVQVEEGRRAEVMCPTLERRVGVRLYVVDQLGRPVQDALVWIDNIETPQRTMTNALGFVDFESMPGVWARMEAMHEGWGRGELSYYIPWRQPTDPPRIELNQVVGGGDPAERIAELAGWGILAVQRDAGFVVDLLEPGSPAEGSGLRRGDALLWMRALSPSRYSIGVRRRAEVLSFELLREP